MKRSICGMRAFGQVLDGAYQAYPTKFLNHETAR